jgi:quercetin dioxygenase-like cupin family protein
MQRNLKNEIILNQNSKSIKLLSHPSFKVIGLGFKKDQILEKHKTSTAAVLIVQFGEVDFFISETTYHLKPGDFFEIPENIEHEVRSITDSYLYLVK